jgi:hypothetical protein
LKDGKLIQITKNNMNDFLEKTQQKDILIMKEEYLQCDDTQKKEALAREIKKLENKQSIRE